MSSPPGGDYSGVGFWLSFPAVSSGGGFRFGFLPVALVAECLGVGEGVGAALAVWDFVVGFGGWPVAACGCAGCTSCALALWVQSEDGAAGGWGEGVVAGGPAHGVFFRGWCGWGGMAWRCALVEVYHCGVVWWLGVVCGVFLVVCCVCPHHVLCSLS